MPPLRERFRLLGRWSPALRERVLAGALAYASGEEADRLARELLEGAGVEGRAAVVHEVHRLTEQGYAGIVRRPNVLADGIRHAVNCVEVPGPTPRPREQTLRNAIGLIVAGAQLDMIDVVAALCRHDDHTLGELAAGALRRLVSASLDIRRRCDGTADLSGRVDEAVWRALSDSRGGARPDVLLAAALILPNSTALQDRLARREHDAIALALRAVPRRLDDPLVRANLVRWLGDATIGPAAARALASTPDLTVLDRVLHAGHLLRAPSRRRAIRTMARPTSLLSALRNRGGLASESQRALPDLISSLDLTIPARCARLGGLVALDDDIARMNALRRLISFDAPPSDVISFAFDVNPNIAFIAAWRLLRDEAAPGAGDDPLDRLLRSPHGRVRRLAERRAVTRRIDFFFARMASLSPAARHVAALAHRTARPEALVEGIRRRLVQGGRAEKRIAISLVGRLGLARETELELLLAAASLDVHIASASITVLAQSESKAAETALRSALRHRDARVRANAIEAIALRGDSADLSLIEPMIHRSASHTARERANALLAFVRSADGRWSASTGTAGPRDEVRSMLLDSDPHQQRSALWLAERSRDPDLLDDVRALAQTASHRMVRLRAVQASRVLCAIESGAAQLPVPSAGERAIRKPAPPAIELPS